MRAAIPRPPAPFCVPQPAPTVNKSWSARAAVNGWELGARGEVAAQRADLNLESPLSRGWQTLRKAGSKRKRQFGRLKQAAGRTPSRSCGESAAPCPRRTSVPPGWLQATIGVTTWHRQRWACVADLHQEQNPRPASPANNARQAARPRLGTGRARVRIAARPAPQPRPACAASRHQVVLPRCSPHHRARRRLARAGPRVCACWLRSPSREPWICTAQISLGEAKHGAARGRTRWQWRARGQGWAWPASRQPMPRLPRPRHRRGAWAACGTATCRTRCTSGMVAARAHRRKLPFGGRGPHLRRFSVRGFFRPR